MANALNILLLEQPTGNIDLIQRQCQGLHVSCKFHVAKDKSAFCKLLDEFRPQLVVSNYNLAKFPGSEVLSSVKAQNKLTPVIFLTKEYNEASAMDAIRNGADDMISMTFIERLPAAILRSLREKNEKREKQLYLNQLKAITHFNNAMLHEANWNTALKDAFRVMGETAYVDRVHYFENGKDKSTGLRYTSQKSEWSRSMATSQDVNPELNSLPFESIGELIYPLQKKQPFKVNTAELAQGKLKSLLTAHDVKSMLALPLFIDNHFHGFLRLDDCTSTRDWSAKEIQFLETLAHNLSAEIGRRRSTKIIEQGREQFNSLINNIPGIAYRCQADEHRTIKFISDGVESLTGYSATDFINNRKRSFTSIIHPEDLEKTYKVMKPLKAGEVFYLQYRIVSKSGNIVWIEERGNGIYNERGNLQWIDGVIINTTEKKETEKTLKQTYAQLQTALEIARLGYWTHDLVNNRGEWSPEVHDIWERQQHDELFIPNFEQFIKTIHPDDVYLFLMPMDEAFPDSGFRETEHRIVTPEGKIKWIAQRLRLIRDRKGVPLKLEGIAQDITERKTKDFEITSVKNLQESIANSTKELIWAIDREFKLMYANNAYYEKMHSITGHRFEPGMSIIEHPSVQKLMNGKYPKIWQAYLERVFNNAEDLHFTEDYDEGDQREIRQVNINPIYNHEGRVSGVACFSEDMTEYLENVRAIEQQNKRLKEIAWLQSHVVRAPLARIMGLVELIGLNEADRLDHQELLQMLARSAYELDEVIAELVKKASRVERK